MFYENLFKGKENIDIEETSLKNIEDRLPKLNDTERMDIEKDITLEE